MVVSDIERTVARQIFAIAVGVVAARERPSIAEVAREALESPSPSTIRALLDVCRGAAWLPSVMDALAQVGIVAAEDILGNPQ